MDALDILTDDHRRIRHLLARLCEPATDSGARMHLFAEVQRELELHGQLEEDLFYPTAFGGRQGAERAHSDHRTITNLLGLLDASPLDSPLWRQRAADLREAVEQHVAWEEREVFDRAGRYLSAGDRHRLAEQMQSERDHLTGLRGSVDDLMT